MRITFYVLALLMVCAFSLYTKRSTSSKQEDARPPAVAGSFYPADPAELGKMLDQFLAQAQATSTPAPWPRIRMPC